MTCKTHAPRSRRHRNANFYQPHFGNLVNEFFNSAVGDVVVNKDKKRLTNPAVNVVEYDNRFELQLALPGLTKEDVTISYEDEKLVVAAKDEKEETEINYRLREFNYEGFKKHFRLPDAVDTGAIKASFELGILSITLAKKEEEIPQPARKITID